MPPLETRSAPVILSNEVEKSRRQVTALPVSLVVSDGRTQGSIPWVFSCLERHATRQGETNPRRCSLSRKRSAASAAGHGVGSVRITSSSTVRWLPRNAWTRSKSIERDRSSGALPLQLTPPGELVPLDPRIMVYIGQPLTVRNFPIRRFHTR